MSTNKSSEEAKIRALMQDMVQAVKKKDIDKVMSNYAPDIVSFDAVSRLQFKGVEEYRKHWDACLNYCPGESIFEIHEVSVTADENIAFSHNFTFCGGEGPDGEVKSGWMRATTCYRKIGGEWKIVHEHYSAPFDMATGQMLFDLKP